MFYGSETIGRSSE